MKKANNTSPIIIEFFNSDIAQKMLARSTRKELDWLQGMGIRKDAVIVSDVVKGEKIHIPRYHPGTIYLNTEDGKKFIVFRDNSALRLDQNNVPIENN